VLRRLLHLAVEWGLIEQAPRIKMLGGERHREFVLTSEEEAKYLAAAPEPLESVCCHSRRYWFAARRVLSAEVGVHNLGKWQTRHTDGDARQDSPQGPPDDATSAGHSTGPLGGCWEADRGLRVACSEQERAYGAVKPQETTRKGAEALESASVCPLQPSAHVSDATWRIGM